MHKTGYTINVNKHAKRNGTHPTLKSIRSHEILIDKWYKYNKTTTITDCNNNKRQYLNNNKKVKTSITTSIHKITKN